MTRRTLLSLPLVAPVAKAVECVPPAPNSALYRNAMEVLGRAHSTGLTPTNWSAPASFKIAMFELCTSLSSPGKAQRTYRDLVGDWAKFCGIPVIFRPPGMGMEVWLMAVVDGKPTAIARLGYSVPEEYR